MGVIFTETGCAYTSYLYRTQQQIGSHLQTLKACYLSRLVKAPWISSDIICRIMTLSTFKPFAMHDAVYRLLQDEIRLMENDPQALEVVINCTAPTLRQAITCMRLHYSRESRSWILRLIRQENLPNLQSLSIRMSSTRKSQSTFQESLKTANPNATITIIG